MISETLIKALGKEECVSILEDVNDELYSYRSSPEQISSIVSLCVMVRKQLEYLRIKEKNVERFLHKNRKEEIESLTMEERERLAKNLADAQDFESRCVVDYINQLNYEVC